MQPILATSGHPAPPARRARATQRETVLVGDPTPHHYSSLRVTVPSYRPIRFVDLSIVAHGSLNARQAKLETSPQIPFAPTHQSRMGDDDINDVLWVNGMDWLTTIVVALRMLGIGRARTDQLSSSFLSSLGPCATAAVELVNDPCWVNRDQARLDNLCVALHGTVWYRAGGYVFCKVASAYDRFVTGIPQATFTECEEYKCEECKSAGPYPDSAKLRSLICVNNGAMSSYNISLIQKLQARFELRRSGYTDRRCPFCNAKVQCKATPMGRPPHVLALKADFDSPIPEAQRGRIPTITIPFTTSNGQMDVQYEPVAIFHVHKGFMVLTILVSSPGGRNYWVRYGDTGDGSFSRVAFQEVKDMRSIDMVIFGRVYGSDCDDL